MITDEDEIWRLPAKEIELRSWDVNAPNETRLVPNWSNATITDGLTGITGPAVRDRANLFDDSDWSVLNTSPRDQRTANGLARPKQDGETWHHNPEPGDMYLLGTDFHQAFTNHTGGRRTYGDDENRVGLPVFGRELFEDL